MLFYAAVPRAYVRDDLPPGRYLVSAAKFWCPCRRRFAKLKSVPEREWIVDSGAYSFPGGVPYTTAQYLDFARQFSPVGVVAVDKYRDSIRTIQHLERDAELLRGSGLPVWPVITGNNLGGYEACARKVVAVYPGAPRYAVGGLKRRLDIAQLVGAIHQHATPLHLLGAVVWQVRRVVRHGFESEAVSFDTGAWNVRFGRSLEEHRRLQREHAMTQRRVDLEILLPRYRDKFEAVEPLLHSETGC